MVLVGKTNHLKVVKSTDFGLYLDGYEMGEILLPRRYCPEKFELGQSIEVFVYYDSEDRLIATTEEAYAHVGDVAQLEVVSVERVGAFLDWGLSKDLFLPYGEQTRNLKPGQDVFVYVYIDNTDRISSSMKLDKFLEKDSTRYKEGDKVFLLIIGKSELGYKALINKDHVGVIYNNEVFQELDYGQELEGYIKKIRADGKIDLRLDQAGHKASGDIGEKILALLKEKGGYLQIDDKTNPERIYELFGVSKKKYKMALGGLYKKRLIRIEEDGIYLV